jgi:pimeloyl-ACP methyl ester carboxylesterase
MRLLFFLSAILLVEFDGIVPTNGLHIDIDVDGFQSVDYAERYEREIPKTRLVRIKSAGHIPMENNPNAVAGALAEFFAAER